LFVAAMFAADASPAVSQPQQSADTKKICQRQASTGSRLEAKKCLTRAEWARIETEQRREARDYLKRPTHQTQ